MLKKLDTLFFLSLRIFCVTVVLATCFMVYRNYQILKQVHQFDTQVEQALVENGISEYKDLALSIIFTESKGKGEDPMQSSESYTGETGQISTPTQSITQGVAFLAQAIQRSKELKTDIWTAVQAYNYGLDYIDYVAKNGGENTVELAESYSKDILSPQLGNQEREQYRYYAWRSFLYNGGYLYHNGGNMFYADLVKTNQWKIKLSNSLFDT
ncbi:lysozyme family protein [Enterococcus bulliens]